MKVIFDLDGTLWETGDGYIYSYNKACQELKIPEDKIQNDEFVLGYLGMKLEDLVQTIIPEAPDKMELGHILLKYVIEYLITHPKTNSKNIIRLFKTLSSQNELYIVSNCPRPFLEAFYQVSGVKEYITSDNTIENYSKQEAIKHFTNNYSEKAVFVGDSSADYAAIEDHNTIQFVYAAYGYYKECSDYNYYLEDLDYLPSILSGIQSVESILKNKKYEVICNKGTSVTLIEKDNCKYFGFMNIKNSEDFDFVLEKLKEKCGDKTVYGPINGNSWYNYRLALNEFDFELYPDCYGNKEILKKFLNSGFEIAEKYTSTVTTLNLNKWGFKNIKLPEGYEGKIVRGRECNDYLDQIYEVSCHCFRDHEFYEDIDLQTFKLLYSGLLSQCSAYLAAILYNGKVVGFNFVYPDEENHFLVDKTIAIEAAHRNPAVLLKLIELSNEVIKELGFDKVLMHFQNVKNITMQSYFTGTIIKQKEYGVLKYERNK